MKWIAILFMTLSISKSFAGTDFAVKEWNAAANNKKPFVFYISGDGGLNSFSTAVCQSIFEKGYNITALNAKSYFWEKKTPETSAADITAYLQKKVTAADGKIILIGYSFGADVLPFIINKLPDATRKKISSVVLLSPSASTDFEIHWSDILGGNKKRSMSVVEEMNKLNVPKTAALFGSDEKEFPVKDIKIKNFSSFYLPGGHHFEGNTEEVSKIMVGYF
ncbi:MAG: virulence factor family protein [Chitinophagaceae bacterium]|nr:virulence factor family protein [Chitinophagaceae bacterium]